MKIMILLLLVTLSGCASVSDPEPVDSSHPASPRAAEAPIRLPAPLLSTHEALEEPANPASAHEHGPHGGHP